MRSSEEELRSCIVEFGKKLQNPPSSVKELLPILNRMEVYLSHVEQSPSMEIQNALSPTMKAFVGDKLLKHPDVDVRVAVASCLSEITRITAPEVPYEDDQMKEVFQLIVSSFKRLDDMSSQSYSKRTSILETVDKVRSSVVMLDLECDGLILEMFRHFIYAIRNSHPENVYSCMESIMTRVIEESEEISSDLLFCILDSLKKDNKEVMPIAQKLMKKVIETSADKLKPYIENALRNKGVSLADYDEVVSLICNEASAEKIVQSEHTEASVVNVVDVSKPVISTTETVQTAEEMQAVVVNSVELPAGDCSELVTRSGNAVFEADTLSGSSTLQDSKASYADKLSEIVTAYPSASVSNPDVRGAETDTKASETIIDNPEIKDGDLEAEKVFEEELLTKPSIEKIGKKRGRKPKAKKKATESKLDGKSISSVKQREELAESEKSCCKEMSPSAKESLDEAAANQSSPKPLEAFDEPSKELYGESEDGLNGSSKTKTMISDLEDSAMLDDKIKLSADDSTEQTATPNVDISDLKTAVSAVDVSVDKTVNDQNLENTTTLVNDGSKEVAAPTIDEPMEEIETSAGKSVEPVGGLSEDSRKVEEGNKKRERGKGKATLKKLAAQAAVEDNKTEAYASQKSSLKPVNINEGMEETPLMGHKRRRIETNSSESKDYGEELVGAKVKVWWPADKRFYKGIIESFDSAKNKHKVLYADGEVENLILKKQRWEMINPDEDSDTDEETHLETPVTEKGSKSKDANEDSSKKRLGRPPSNKSKNAANKSGHKSDIKAVDDSKGAEEKTDISKEEEEPKAESGKRLGRPRARVSQSTGRSTADETSSNGAGKSKVNESTVFAKSSRKSKTAGILEDDTISVKQKDTKVKGLKSGNATPVIKSAGRSKAKEPNKSKSSSVAKEETLKALAKVEVDPSCSEGEEAAEERTQSPAKAAGSSKRKASALEKENKSGAKPLVKGKRGRKH